MFSRTVVTTARTQTVHPTDPNVRKGELLEASPHLAHTSDQTPHYSPPTHGAPVHTPASGGPDSTSRLRVAPTPCGATSAPLADRLTPSSSPGPTSHGSRVLVSDGDLLEPAAATDLGQGGVVPSRSAFHLGWSAVPHAHATVGQGSGVVLPTGSVIGIP